MNICTNLRGLQKKRNSIWDFNSINLHLTKITYCEWIWTIKVRRRNDDKRKKRKKQNSLSNALKLDTRMYFGNLLHDEDTLYQLEMRLTINKTYLVYDDAREKNYARTNLLNLRSFDLKSMSYLRYYLHYTREEEILSKDWTV